MADTPHRVKRHSRALRSRLTSRSQRDVVFTAVSGPCAPRRCDGPRRVCTTIGYCSVTASGSPQHPRVPASESVLLSPPPRCRGHEPSGKRYAVVVLRHAMRTTVAVPTSTEQRSLRWPQIVVAGQRTLGPCDVLAVDPTQRLGDPVDTSHPALRIDESLACYSISRREETIRITA